jgi:hypothetical protein
MLHDDTIMTVLRSFDDAELVSGMVSPVYNLRQSEADFLHEHALDNE